MMEELLQVIQYCVWEILSMLFLLYHCIFQATDILYQNIISCDNHLLFLFLLISEQTTANCMLTLTLATRVLRDIFTLVSF